MIEQRLARGLLLAIGLEELRNPRLPLPEGTLFALAHAALTPPSPRLRRRILAAAAQFYRELLSYRRPEGRGLWFLTGRLPTDPAWWREALAATPVELLSGVALRSAKQSVSQLTLRRDYREALKALRAARREHHRAPVRTAWAAAFPRVPVAEWKDCDTAAAAAAVVLQCCHRALYGHLSVRTLIRLARSTPTWEHERRVADMTDPGMVAALLALRHAATPPRRPRA